MSLPTEDPDFPGYDTEGGDPFDVAFLRRRVRENPFDGRRWLRLGFLLGREGERDAITVLERASELLPDNSLAYYLLGRARGCAGDRAGAMRALEAAVRLRPDRERAWVVLGVIRLSDGQLDGALLALTRAARLVADGETYWEIARCFVAMGRIPEAMVALEEAVRLQPNHTVAHGALALLASARGESEVRRRHLQLLFTLDEGMARDLDALMEQ